MAQRIHYTHFFDLIHKLIIVFGPIGTIVCIAYLVTEKDMSESLGIFLCIFIIALLILYSIFLRAVPTFFYVLFKFNVKLNYEQMNYCHPLFSGLNWYPCDNILSLPRNQRKAALIQTAKQLFHQYDKKDCPKV